MEIVDEGMIVWDKEKRTLALTLPTDREGVVAGGVRHIGVWRVIYWKEPNVIHLPCTEDLVPIIRIDRKDFQIRRFNQTLIGNPKKIFEKYIPDVFAEIFRRFGEISST